MSAPNRAALLNKTIKILKKHYQPVAPPADRSLLEHLLYACCLENSPYEAADEVFAKLQENYFDWNEVRVTTVAELSEVMSPLADPAEAAQRLKRTLQSVFEKHYSFDIDPLKKQNLGKAVKDLEAFAGATPFTVAYATQHALGGHAIPLNSGLFAVFVVLGVVTEAEANKQRIPGLERTIAKSKGVECSSLLHQLAVDYAANPHSTNVRAVLLEIAPDAKDRLPKRSSKTAKSKDEAAAGEEDTSSDGEAKRGARAKRSTTAAETKKSSTKRLTRKKPR